MLAKGEIMKIEFTQDEFIGILISMAICFVITVVVIGALSCEATNPRIKNPPVLESVAGQ